MAKTPTPFWERVNKNGPEAREGLGPCWLWTGHVEPRGYGILWLNRKNSYAHRESWRQANGDIPEDLMIRHSCDVRHCVNPAHMSLGTNVDNMRDMVERGRACKGERKPQAKLNDEKVVELRALRRSGLSYSEIGRRFGIAAKVAERAAHGFTWKHVPNPVTVEEEVRTLPSWLLSNADRRRVA